MKIINKTSLIYLFFCTCATHAMFTSAHAQLSNESGVGIVSTTGNTETSTISLKQLSKYQVERNTVQLNGRFLQASNRSVESAYQWGVALRFERNFYQNFSIFLGETVESDKYQKLAQRYSTDVGGKIDYVKNDQWLWLGECGYRFTRENYTTGLFSNFNFLRAYNEVERKFDSRVSAKWWMEYLPNITRWKAYQFNTELALVASLSNMFSLKTGYGIRYYNEPPAGVTQTTDTTFTTALVAKF